MADKLIDIPNIDTQNYPICELQLDYNLMNQPIKSNKSHKICQAIELENVNIKLWVQV